MKIELSKEFPDSDYYGERITLTIEPAALKVFLAAAQANNLFLIVYPDESPFDY